MIRTFNRIGAALACALIAAWCCAELADLLAPVGAPMRPAFAIAGDTAAASGPPVIATAAVASIDQRLAHASAQHGAVLAAQNCESCHTLVGGAPSTVGPNLFAVVGRPVAHVAGFGYSAALTALGGRWSPNRLDTWLAGPQAMAPGTLMGFAGLPDPSDRADLIAYLRTLAPPPGERTAGDKTAEGGATANNATGGGGDFAALVARADPKAGAALAATQCGACHGFDQGGVATVGPNLFGVVGRGIAQAADFRYSPALTAHGGSWTEATLDSWLAGPAWFAPGTRMGFPGIADPAQRAAVVAYLRTLHP